MDKDIKMDVENINSEDSDSKIYEIDNNSAKKIKIDTYIRNLLSKIPDQNQRPSDLELTYSNE